jgi:hypothetical protein
VTDPAFAEPSPPMRCIDCFYVLDNLESHRCPECGRDFDPLDSRTFTRKPPFIWWTFWMPAMLLSGVGGGVVWLVLIPLFGFTWSTTIVVPLAIGGVVGYGAGYKSWRAIVRYIIPACLALALAMTIIFKWNLVGILCSCVLVGIALIPVAIGVLMGIILRSLLLNSSFSHRDYLRSFLIKFLILLLPVIAAILEGRHDNMPPVAITTTGIVDAPPEAAWRGIQFYEEVHRPTPWLLWLSGSLRPKYTIGKSAAPGDRKTCVYEKGELIKVITEVIPNRRLAFRVVKQEQIENHSIILLDGSFDLEPVDGGRRTLVHLTTRYIPLLEPRFAYLPAETLTVHTLHEHVLAGMRDKAEEHTR